MSQMRGRERERGSEGRRSSRPSHAISVSHRHSADNERKCHDRRCVPHHVMRRDRRRIGRTLVGALLLICRMSAPPGIHFGEVRTRGRVGLMIICATPHGMRAQRIALCFTTASQSQLDWERSCEVVIKIQWDGAHISFGGNSYLDARRIATPTCARAS